MGKNITAAARARLEAAAPPGQSPAADPELQAARREVALLMAATEREAGAVVHKAWRAGPEKAAGRGWWRR
jgi:hypothetical protein